MRIAVAAGGTGGHFYPGLAVAQEARRYSHEICFFVRNDDVVIPFLKAENIPFVQISGAGFERKLSFRNLLTPIKLLCGFFQALRAFWRQKPDVLLAMGGYVSFSPALAAKFFGIPVILHEQNAKPGLANRVLSRLARRVAVSFEKSLALFGNKGVLTGNPVRLPFFQLPEKNKARETWGLNPDKKTVLVFGGSLGAHRLNELVVGIIPEVLKRQDYFQFLHFSGSRDIGWVKESFSKYPFGSFVSAYCHEMEKAYAACDLVICRAGASTLSELMVVKKPAILVPYPFAAEDHQKDNALVLGNRGAGLVLDQKDLTEEKFLEYLDGFFNDSSQLGQMAKAFEGQEADFSKSATSILKLVEEQKK